MSYVPHTDDERRDMLAAVGAERLADLFADVPENIRFPKLDLPAALPEADLVRAMKMLAGHNLHAAGPHTTGDTAGPQKTGPDTAGAGPPFAGAPESFLGAGVYHHFRPATVDYIVGRGEFYTSYTQYQPEVSQGMLQALFEYQSMICRLTGMEVASASHYNGANALAEAVLLALDPARRRGGIVMSPALHPQYREVVRTYLSAHPAEITGDDDRAALDPARLMSKISADTAAIIVQNPNFFGQIEPLEALVAAAHGAGALAIVITDPIFLGLFRPPGACGADVVVAEGQPLGIPPSFGGPHLGIFATRMVHVRRMSGHLAGETRDACGRRGWVLTLATREQHIRRARATSNICTNSALCALAATVYLATMGRNGLRRAAELCWHHSHYAATAIARIEGVAVNPPPLPQQPFFKEFVVRLPHPAAVINARLREDGVVGGYDLGNVSPDLRDHMLIAVTEVNTRTGIDRLVAALRKAVS
jgi:glycine dehydrogenase subunit 1